MINLHKGLSQIGISNLTSNVILGLFWIIIARLVSVEDYGFLGFHIAFATIVGAVCIPGITNTIMTYGNKDDKLRGPILTISILFLVLGSIILYLLLESISTSFYVLAYPLFGLIIADLLSRSLENEFYFYIGN